MPTADVVKQARRALGMTQEELAAALGRSRKTIVRWEAGETEPKHSDIERLLALTQAASPPSGRKPGRSSRR